MAGHRGRSAHGHRPRLATSDQRSENRCGGSVQRKDIPLEEAKPVNFKPHKIEIYFGTITYMDVFHQKHTAHYCIRRGELCNEGNDAD